ncbi:unnamed protein product [Mytilus edulis]|uniref:C-type lectin domain-containing protein n=1 Tax=Mytilus edulis TaxID=6550 RepID=A0A8S3ST78_MYTED|nr:unnamed protein product [Mytilus edulis]
MWRSAFKIILILNNDLVSANYVINNSSSVTWTDAQKLCNVPSVGDIMFKERGYTELPKTIIAWTSSLSSTSDWTFFHGHVITSVFVNQFPENTTEPVFEGTTKHTSTDISEEQRPGAANNKIDLFIVAGGAVSFTMIIIFLLVIIYIQRRKLIKAAFTSLTVRRDQSNYNEIPQQMSESTTRHYDEVSPLSEIAASKCHPADQQNIEQIQHIDLSGYLVPSNM